MFRVKPKNKRKILFMSLSGWLDGDGDEIGIKGNSFLPSDSLLWVKMKAIISNLTLSGQLLGNIGRMRKSL